MLKEELLEKGYIITSNLPPKKKSGIYLWGHFMHGDADHYSDESIQLDSVEELEAILEYIKWTKGKSHNEEITYRQESKGEKAENDFYTIVGQSWRPISLWDGVLDWWPNDVTNDWVRASLESYWIIFVDIDGKEFNVVKL